MLYLCFRAIVIFLSIMAFISMTSTGNHEYIILPITMFIWVLYTFFDEDDKEYRRRHGIKPNKSWWGWDDYDGYGYYGGNGGYYDGSRHYHSTTHHTPSTESTGSTRITGRNDPTYKKIVKRCRKSVNVTIDKINPKKEE